MKGLIVSCTSVRSLMKLSLEALLLLTVELLSSIVIARQLVQANKQTLSFDQKLQCHILSERK